jgi:hypothetical protein
MTLQNQVLLLLNNNGFKLPLEILETCLFNKEFLQKTISIPKIFYLNR